MRATSSSSSTSPTPCAPTNAATTSHIKDYIENAGSKALLLTATPYNIRFRDVANQFGLYIDDDDDLGLQPLSAMQPNPRLAERVDGKINTLLAFRKSEEADDWKRLMSEHLVRRTRSFIRNNYAKIDPRTAAITCSSPTAVGSTFRSALRSRSSTRSVTTTPAAIMASDNTLNTIDGLAAAPVQPRSLSRRVSERKTADETATGRAPRARQRSPDRLHPHRPLQAPVIVRPLVHAVTQAPPRPQRDVALRHRERS